VNENSAGDHESLIVNIETTAANSGRRASLGMPSLFREKAGEKNQRGDQRIIFRNFQQKTKGGSIIYEK
jgi:hypothetical protein